VHIPKNYKKGKSETESLLSSFKSNTTTYDYDYEEIIDDNNGFVNNINLKDSIKKENEID